MQCFLICRNADSERGFSILRKIDTDQRPSLKQDTLIALMTMSLMLTMTAMIPASVMNFL